jgi:hypothetical protein
MGVHFSIFFLTALILLKTKPPKHNECLGRKKHKEYFIKNQTAKTQGAHEL